jgi:hypothetical protein
MGKHGPLHEKRVCMVQPGLSFVGLHFLYAMSSSMVQGVSRDASRVVSAMAGCTESAVAASSSCLASNQQSSNSADLTIHTGVRPNGC